MKTAQLLKDGFTLPTRFVNHPSFPHWIAVLYGDRVTIVYAFPTEPIATYFFNLIKEANCPLVLKVSQYVITSNPDLN